MKDFLRLNLILSTEKIDENDDAESLIDNIKNTTSPKKSIIAKPSTLNTSLSTSLLYVKSIKSFESEEECEKNLKPNDLVIKINEEVVSTLEEFKLMLYKILRTTNTPQIINLTVKRKLKKKEKQIVLEDCSIKPTEEELKAASIQHTNSILSLDSHNSNYSLNKIDDLNDVNITIASNQRIANQDENRNESNYIQNFQNWFSSPGFAQYFFHLYSHDNVITEEYLQAYNTFNNFDMNRLEILFEAMKEKVLSKTQDYVQEFKLLKSSSVSIDMSKIANYNEENRSKNRYRNVVPYDYNRVKLVGNQQNNDYINASHICLPLHQSQKNELGERYTSNYILAQPPLNNTIGINLTTNFCQLKLKTFLF